MGGRPYSVVGLVCTNSDYDSRSNPDHGAGSFQVYCFAFCAGMGGKPPSISDLSVADSFPDELEVVSADLDTGADVVVEADLDTDSETYDADADPDADLDTDPDIDADIVDLDVGACWFHGDSFSSWAGMGGRPYSVVGTVCTNSDHESLLNPDDGASS